MFTKRIEFYVADRNFDVSVELNSLPVEETLLVFDNGLLLSPKRDYTLDDKTISFKKVGSFASDITILYTEKGE